MNYNPALHQHLLQSKPKTLKQRPTSSITRVNYHTLINPSYIPTNSISKEMSILFSTVITFNTDKPILGAGHRNQVGRSVTHTDSIWG